MPLLRRLLKCVSQFGYPFVPSLAPETTSPSDLREAGVGRRTGDTRSARRAVQDSKTFIGRLLSASVSAAHFGRPWRSIGMKFDFQPLEPRLLMTTLYWDTSSSAGLQGGSGTWSTSVATWNTASDGSGSHVAWTSGDDAVFSGSPYNYPTVTISGAVTANSVSFQVGGYTIAGTMLTLTGSSTVTSTAYAYVNTPIVGNPTFNGNISVFGSAAGITGNATFNGGSENQVPISGNATFNNSVDAGNIAGTATFNGNSTVYWGATITGSATFNDSSVNEATVGTNSVFNNSALNEGRVSGTATFNDSAANYYGTVTSDATFNSTSQNTGTIQGNAAFNGTSQNFRNVEGNATFSVYSGGVINLSGTSVWSGNVDGSVIGGDGATIATWNFSDASHNAGFIHGNAAFSGTSYNAGTIDGTATFSYASDGILTLPQSTTWGAVNGAVKGTDGIIISQWVFENGYNRGIVPGNAIFNGGSGNGGTVSGNATFNSSINNGLISGSAIFNGSSSNGSGYSLPNVSATAIVDGNATFNGSSSNSGEIKGNATFAYASAGVVTLSGNMIWGTVDGTATGTDGVAITKWIFRDSSYNTSIIDGDATFIYASAGSIYLNNMAWGPVHGHVAGGDGVAITNWTFDWSSENLGNVNGNAVFSDSSYNYGTVYGDATFDSTSSNEGLVVFNQNIDLTGATLSGGGEYLIPSNVVVTNYGGLTIAGPNNQDPYPYNIYGSTLINEGGLTGWGSINNFGTLDWRATEDSLVQVYPGNYGGGLSFVGPLNVSSVTINAGQTQSVQVGSFSDFDPTATNDQFVVTIDWLGDSSRITTGTVASDGNGGFIISGMPPTGVSGTYTPIITLTDYGYGSSSQNAFYESSSGIFAATTAAPSIARSAHAMVALNGKTASLSVLGTISTADSSLIYAWSPYGSQPAPVTFSTNGTNTAKNTTATFSAAGNYTFVVTITDGLNLAISSLVHVDVSQVFSGIAVNSGSGSPLAGGTQQLSAVAIDQFGAALATQPSSFAWSVSGTGYQISSGGLLTAPTSIGPYNVTATSGTITSDPVRYTPKISITSATATMDSTGLDAVLNVVATGPNGESNLTYSWYIENNAPGYVSFSDNGTNTAKNATATFSAMGTYILLVIATDINGTATSSMINVTISPVLTSIVVNTTQAPAIASGETQQFTATAYDQFGIVLAAQPEVTWSVNPAWGFNISSTGLLTTTPYFDEYGSPNNYSYYVMATSGSMTSDRLFQNSQASFTTLYNPALDTSGTFAKLDANATEPNGRSDFIYKWTVTSGNAADVTFEDNNDSTAGVTVADFSATGYYDFSVIATDPQNNSISRMYIAVNVGQVLTTIAATPIDPVSAANGSQQFTATAYDQFGQPIQTQPAINWVVDGSGYNISASGVLTAPASALGDYTVAATFGGVTSPILPFSQKVTVATAPTATIDTNNQTTATLNVLGADAAGESMLTYTWSVVGNYPSGVTFSDNGTNTAKNTVATFTSAGTYDFLVQITDANGLETSAGVSLTFYPNFSSIAVTTTTVASYADSVFTSQAVIGTGSIGGVWSNYELGNTGSDIYGTADAFTYDYRPFTGNGQIIAEVNSVSNTNPWTKAGVMFRSSVDANAEEVFVAATPGNGVTFQSRNAVGAATNYIKVTGLSAPYWVKLIRSGNTFTAYSSPDGTTWTQTGSPVTIAMGTTIYVGLALTSHDSNNWANANFSNVVINSSVDPGLHIAQHYAATANDQFGNPLPAQPDFTFNVAGTGYTITSSGLLIAPSNPSAYAVTASSGSVTSPTLSYSPSVSIVTPASATLDPSATSASLSVLGTDVLSGFDLTYTWSVTSGNADNVYFSDNADPTANTVTASFAAAGNYTFLVTITDPANHTVTSSVSQAVAQTLSRITIATAAAIPTAGGTQQFTAVGYDQFGNAMTTQPTFTWSVTGTGCTISSTGLLTSPSSSPGDYSVTASVGSGSTAITSNTLPFSQTVTIVTAPTATPASPTTATLNVLGADPAGESTLTYIWSTTGASPAGVSFADNVTNSAKSTTVTFSQAGSYTFLVEILDANGLETSRSFTYTVAPVLTSLSLVAATAAPIGSGTQQFTATAYDQFGVASATQPAISFSVTGSGYAINATTGLLTATATSAAYTVTAASGGLNKSLSFASSLTITSPASANVSSDQIAATLTVQATDALGGTDLTYIWSLASGNAANVSFEDNYDNTANNTVADFYAAGTYAFTVTVADANGDTLASTTSSVTLNAITTSISVITSDPVPGLGGTQQFTALALDQFGNLMATQPSFNWSSTGYGISPGGLITAGSNVSGYTVTASANGVTGSPDTTSQAPIIISPASKILSSNQTSATLSVVAADMTGTDDLSYEWADNGNTGNVSFDDNTSPVPAATFSAAGTYTLTVTVTNGNGQSVTSNVGITVAQVLTSIKITSNSNPVVTGGQKQLSAEADDQFGAAMSSPPAFTWTIPPGTSNGIGASSGNFTAGGAPGTASATVTVPNGNGTLTTSTTFSISKTATTPVIDDQTFNVMANTSTTFNVLTGDTDGNAPYVAHFLAVTSQPSDGTVTVNLSGQAVYTPDPGFDSTDSFTITTYNSDWLGSTATITVNVAPPSGNSPTSTFPANNFPQYTFIPTFEGYVDGGDGTDAVNTSADGLTKTYTITGWSPYETGYSDQLYVGYGTTINILCPDSDPTDTLLLFNTVYATFGNIDFKGKIIIGGYQSVTQITGNVSAGSIEDDTGGPIWLGSGATITTTGDISGLILGNDQGTINAGTIGQQSSPYGGIYILNDLNKNITASGNISGLNIAGQVGTSATISSTGGSVSVASGGTFAGTVKAATGATVTVDHSIYSQMPWWPNNWTSLPNYYTPTSFTGSVTSTSGNVTVNASLAFSGTAKTLGGNTSVLNISARENISGTITATQGSIGTITTPGSISSKIEATSGSIGTVHAGGDIAGLVTASGNINSVTAGGNISYGVSTLGGTVGTVSAGASLAGGITATNGITGSITAGLDFSGGIMATGGSIPSLSIGRDITGGSIQGLSIGSVTAGENLSVQVKATGSSSSGANTGNIGSVSVGEAIIAGAGVVATGGSIGSVSAGGGAWPDPFTASGSIGQVAISAGTSIGSITVSAAPGYTGAINMATITANNGDIGSISAASGINATITAHGHTQTNPDGSTTLLGGNLITITPGIGDLAGSITTDGNIQIPPGNSNLPNTITVIGNLTAALTAGLSIGSINTTGNISGDMWAKRGSIGSITAGDDISGDLNATNTIGNVISGGDISGHIDTGNVNSTGAVSIGDVTAEGSITGYITCGDIDDSSIGSIGNIFAGDSLAGSVTAAGNIGDIMAFATLNKNISAGGSIGGLSIDGDISGDVTAGATIGLAWASGTISGKFTAEGGVLDLFACGNITSSLSALGDITAVACGDISSSLNASHGSISEIAYGGISSPSLNAYTGITVFAGRSIDCPDIQAQGDIDLEAIYNIIAQAQSVSGSVNAVAGGTISGSSLLGGTGSSAIAVGGVTGSVFSKWPTDSSDSIAQSGGTGSTGGVLNAASATAAKSGTRRVSTSGLSLEDIGSVVIGGPVQGVANVLNGAQDGIIGILNLPAVVFNASGVVTGSPVRAEYIQSPDWSNGLIITENGTHNASKFIGGQAALTLASAGASSAGATGALAVNINTGSALTNTGALATATVTVTINTAQVAAAAQIAGAGAQLGNYVANSGSGNKLTPLQNKLNHIFGKATHNLSNLVKQYGTEEKAFQAIQSATDAHVKALGINGLFEEVVNIGGNSITVRGNVMNGVVHIATAFQ